MGGAYTALAEDANALHYNPAGLARIKRSQATFMHNAHIQGLSQQYLGYAHPKHFGLSLNYLGFGNVPRTTIANPNSTLGDFGVSHVAVTAGYGYALDDRMSIGVGLKFLRQVIDDVAAQGAAIDLGAIFHVPEVDGFVIGLAIQNMGPSANFQSSAEKLPLKAKAGGAYVFPLPGFPDYQTTLALDLIKERGTDVTIRFGSEVIVLKNAALRLGYSSRNTAGVGITAGMGWRFREHSLDYALVPFGDLGIAHRFSVTVRWGGSAQP